MSKAKTPAAVKPARSRKSPKPVPADDLHELPPTNRRIKNRAPRKPLRRVVHRVQDDIDPSARMLGCDERELADVPFYSQLLAGIRNGEDID